MRTGKKISIIVTLGSGCGFLAGFFLTLGLLDFQFSAEVPFVLIVGLALTYLVAGLVVRGGML